MGIFIEIMKIVLPTIVGGIFTFLITKYTYNKNVPLDKLEIAYNRIYCPLYQLLYGKKLEEAKLDITKISFYLQKYNKYVDRTTLKAFDLFCKCKDEETLLNFKNNIYNKNTYLRRRLGYLEPGIWQMYAYSPKSEKSTIRIGVELLTCYIFVILVSVTRGFFQAIGLISVIVLLLIIIIETLYLIFDYPYKYYTFKHFEV